jgi:hypothetical protein
VQKRKKKTFYSIGLRGSDYKRACWESEGIKGTYLKYLHSSVHLQLKKIKNKKYKTLLEIADLKKSENIC